MKQLILALGILPITSAAYAGDIGDVPRGRAYAEKMCTGCHAVEAGQPASPLHAAPSFTAVANSPGLTALALNAFFRTSHKTMPNFIIASQDIEDVSAYILSLKGADKR